MLSDSRPLVRLSASRPLKYLLALAVFTAAYLVWILAIGIGRYPEFILPRPTSVLGRLALLTADGTLWRHTSITAEEALGGFLLGLAFATFVGYPLAKSPYLEK